jgi:hypothetical protein
MKDKNVIDHALRFERDKSDAEICLATVNASDTCP